MIYSIWKTERKYTVSFIAQWAINFFFLWLMKISHLPTPTPLLGPLETWTEVLTKISFIETMKQLSHIYIINIVSYVCPVSVILSLLSFYTNGSRQAQTIVD